MDFWNREMEKELSPYPLHASTLYCTISRNGAHPQDKKKKEKGLICHNQMDCISGIQG